MSLNIVDLPTSGGFFKPTEEMKEYAAFLLEVRDFEEQRPGAYGPKDSALVDVTVFKSENALNARQPDEIQFGVRVEQTVLARDLKAVRGGATVVTLAQIPSTKPGQRPAWVWKPVSQAVKQAVAAYATEREAAIVANAPSFDD